MATTGILGFKQTPQEEDERRRQMALQSLGMTNPNMVGQDPSGAASNPFEELKPKYLNATGTPTSVAPANLPEGFQFTGSFADRDKALRQMESDAGAKRQTQISYLDEDHQVATRKAQNVQQQAQKALQAKLAAQGMGQSGAVVVGDQELSTKYQDYLNDLNRSRSRGIADVESDYASVLNSLSRTREGFVREQQEQEEARRLEQARVEAETARLAREEADRKALMDQLLAQQEAQRLANEQAQAALLASRYYPTSIGGGGGGGGGDYYEEPQAPAPQAPKDMVVLPFLSGGQRATQGNIDNWIRQNVDPWVSGTALAKVREVLMSSPQGVDRNDLGWLIRQYPNTPDVPMRDRGRFR